MLVKPQESVPQRFSRLASRQIEVGFLSSSGNDL
jgi:hypothetical protein